MSIWKSPVLYFGFVLVLAISASLLAPFVIDWNAYKPQLEAYGRKLTGRDVTIAGGIAVRLFPWPRLTADNVHIANPSGMANPDFAGAERITVALQLAGLLNGTLQVESVDIDRPVIFLERLAAGQGNWLLSPAAEFKTGELAARVKLDRITLNDAIVHVKDDRRGTGDLQFNLPRTALMAPGFAGPWRAEANGVVANKQRFDTSLSTAAWEAGEPFRFGFTVKPAADSAAGLSSLGYGFSFDGQNDRGKLTGEVRLEPLVESSGKSDAEGKLRRLLATAKVEGDFDQLALRDIQLGPVDPKEGGAVMSGSATVAFGRQIAANFDLSANKLDLRTIAGAQVNAALRQGGVLAAADTVLSMLPENVNLSGNLTAAALATETETLENIVLKVDAGRDAIRVQELSSSLPGRSRALFKGVFFPGKAGAELAGSLALEASDLRQFATWLWPEVRSQVDRLWAGSRGHFKLQSNVNLTESDLRFSKAQYEIDSVPGSFELQVASGGRGTVDLRLDAAKLDIDNLAGGSLGGLARGGNGLLARVLPSLLPQRGSADLRLVVQTGDLLLNGVAAKDVTLDVAAGSNGLDLRTLELGSVGGARLSASGLVLDAGRGPDGSVGLDVAADDPRGLLRLLGLIPPAHDPAWALALGKTALKGTLTVKAGRDAPEIGFDATGSSGDFDAVASGNLAANGDGLSGTFDLRSKNSAALARLAGLTAAADDKSPARITVTASGDSQGGYLADVQAQAFGVNGSFNGTLAAPDRPAVGKLSLRSTDVSTLASAVGLSANAPPESILVLDTAITGNARSLTFGSLSGRIGESPLGGDLTVTADRKVTGKLTVGEMSLFDLLPPVFLGWYGAAPGLESTFAERLPFGLTGEVWLSPKALSIGQTFKARNVQVGVTANGQDIRLALFGKDASGHDASLELNSSGKDANRTLDGKIKLPVDLARQLALAGGGPVAEGSGTVEFHFNAAGRSPGGALAGLKGTGSYDFDNLRFTNISPENFGKSLAGVKNAAGLTAAFDALRGTGGLAITPARGSITADNGIASFSPLKASTPDADALVTTTAELSAGQLDIGVALDLKAQGGLPRMEIAYAGPPPALARSEEKAELAAKLGIAIMQQGVVQLEKLQREQQRLAAQEELQRKDDEAKLAAYYSQRDELLLRKREIKVFSEMRLAAAEKLRREIEAQRAANADINKAELIVRKRELKVFRRMANAAAGQPFAAEIMPPPRPKPAPPKLAKPTAATLLQPVVPEPPAPVQGPASPSQ